MSAPQPAPQVDATRSGTPSNPGRLLTADEVAGRWSCTRKHVYSLSASGRLPTVELGARMKRYRLDAVEAFGRAGGVAANG